MPFRKGDEGGPGRPPLPIAKRARLVSARLYPQDVATLERAGVSATKALREVCAVMRELDDEREDD